MATETASAENLGHDLATRVSASMWFAFRLAVLRSVGPQGHFRKRGNPGRPLIVDQTKAPDQFGLWPKQAEELREEILQGTGSIR